MRRYHIAIAAILAAHAGLLAWGAYRHAPGVDEAGHLVSGLFHWQTGRFELYRVNPPLVRLLATLPVSLWAPPINWDLIEIAQGVRPEWVAGTYFIREFGIRACRIFTIARWACIPLSLLGATVCSAWARQRYGPAAGLTALLLWCFDPNMLGNAQMITPDTGAATFAVIACFCFSKWLRHPDARTALQAGLTLGLAELCKMTLILLYALFPIIWLIDRKFVGRERRTLCLQREGAQLFGIVFLSILTLNLGYGFEGSCRRLDSFAFQSDALSGSVSHGSEPAQAKTSRYGNRFHDSWLGRVPVPLPSQYILGIDEQKADFETRFPSYFRGEWRRQGWWYYYIYGLAIKEPLGTWVLLLLTTATTLCRRRSKSDWREDLILLAPALAILVFVSSQTGFNHHFRYVLPALPFFWIWMSQSATLLTSKNRLGVSLYVFALAWMIGSSLWIYPHSLSYFNELVGGPRRGHFHLLDSNIEWGQDLLELKNWADRHPEARPLYMIHYGILDPEDVGLETSGFPPSGPILQPDRYEVPEGYELGPLPGWYAIGVTFLHADQHPERGTSIDPGIPYCGYFLRFEPVAQIGYSMNVYHITRSEANQARDQLGLAPLPADWKPPKRIGWIQRK